jgi:hypothetical protein
MLALSATNDSVAAGNGWNGTHCGFHLKNWRVKMGKEKYDVTTFDQWIEQ